MYEFADELGVSYSTLSQWMNGIKEPSEKNVRMLAKKFGLDVYDALHLPRPDPDLYYVEVHWINLSSEERKAIREEVAKYVTEK